MSIKPKDVLTQDTISCVNAYLMARAYAETMRDQVNEVHEKLLREFPVYADKATRGANKGEQILNSGDLYLCSDDAQCQFFYDEADIALRECGLKPESMPDTHCPALVAEHLLVKAESLLVDTVAPIFNMDRQRLLCAGMKKYHKFTDLIVGMVVSSPGYKNPLTGKAA